MNNNLKKLLIALTAATALVASIIAIKISILQTKPKNEVSMVIRKSTEQIQVDGKTLDKLEKLEDEAKAVKLSIGRGNILKAQLDLARIKEEVSSLNTNLLKQVDKFEKVTDSIIAKSQEASEALKQVNILKGSMGNLTMQVSSASDAANSALSEVKSSGKKWGITSLSEFKPEKLISEDFLKNIDTLFELYKVHRDEMPDFIKTVMGDEKINVVLSTTEGTKTFACTTKEGILIQLVEGYHKEPTFTVFTTTKIIDKILKSKNPNVEFKASLENKEIEIIPYGVASTAKYKTLLQLLKIFG